MPLDKRAEDTMSQVLVVILIGVFFILVIGELLFYVLKIRAVKGTRQRYIAATMEIGCSLGVIVTLLIWAVVDVATKDIFGAGFSITLAAIRTWQFLRHFDDDDNWFNDQLKLLKRGVKKLRRRIASLSPLPSPSSA